MQDEPIEAAAYGIVIDEEPPSAGMLLMEEFVDPDELNEFFSVAEAAAWEEENGIDIAKELQGIGFLAMTCDPSGYPEPLRSAVTKMREYITCYNEKAKNHPWAYAGDVAEMDEKVIAAATSMLPRTLATDDDFQQLRKIAEFRFMCRTMAAINRYQAELPKQAMRERRQT